MLTNGDPLLGTEVINSSLSAPEVPTARKGGGSGGVVSITLKIRSFFNVLKIFPFFD